MFYYEFIKQHLKYRNGLMLNVTIPSFSVDFLLTETTISNVRNITIKRCPLEKNDETVSDAQDTADGVDDVMLGSIVERDEDGAETFDDIQSFDDNFQLLTLE